ncbi:MAG: dATP/dGTP diphosphohydrolase domain-containing protein [Plesiomonas sp.]
MNLLELLREELPKRGGWPQWAAATVQDGDKEIRFAGDGYDIRRKCKFWIGERKTSGNLLPDFFAPTLASDHATRIVTREEYNFVPTRSDVLASLTANVYKWPTEITDDLPHFPCWTWKQLGTEYVTLESDYGEIITSDVWAMTRVKDTPHGSSVKHDTGKPLMGALPPNAELAVARVLTFGAEKYGRDNWRGLDDSDTRYMDAALRHINAVRRGETHDDESGEHHLAHAVCCLMFMLENSK